MQNRAEQLDEIAKQGGEDGKILQQLLSGTKNPTLDVAYKAKSNYAIAGLKLQDGKRVLGNGAVSVANHGRPDAVLKYRVSADENGKLLSLNGAVGAEKLAEQANKYNIIEQIHNKYVKTFDPKAVVKKIQTGFSPKNKNQIFHEDKMSSIKSLVQKLEDENLGPKSIINTLQTLKPKASNSITQNA